MAITVAEAKAHMDIVGDDKDDLISDYIEAASLYIGKYVSCSMEAEDCPQPVKHAVKMIVASMYESPNAGLIPQEFVSKSGPISVWSLIGPYRRFAFNGSTASNS